MRASAALACLLLLGASAARAAGPTEIRSASPDTLAAVQAVVQSPAGAGLAADAPDLSFARTLRADRPGDLAALGVLSAYLPSDFAAQVSAAAAGDAQAQARSVAALRQAYADAAKVAATVLEARTKRLRRARLTDALGPEEWRRAIDDLAGYAMYGGGARRKVEEWRAWQASRTGETAQAAAVARARSLDGPPVAGVVALETVRGQRAAAAAGASAAGAKVKAMSSPVPAGRVRLRAGTAVPLRLLDPIDSENAYAGHAVLYEVAADVRQDGVRVLREGTRVDGVVRSVEPRGIRGRPGSLAVDPVEIVTDDGVRIPLVRGGDRSEPPAGKNVWVALAALTSGLTAHLLVAPMPQWVFLALFAATALLFIFTTGYSARAKEKLSATTEKDADVRADPA